LVACCTSTTCAYYHRHSCTNTFRSSPPFGGSSPSAVFLLLHTPQASHIHTRAIATAVEFLRSTQLLYTHTAHTERTARTDLLHALHSRCLYALHYTLGACVLYCTALSVMCTLHCKCMTVPCTPPQRCTLSAPSSLMHAQCCSSLLHAQCCSSLLRAQCSSSFAARSVLLLVDVCSVLQYCIGLCRLLLCNDCTSTTTALQYCTRLCRRC